MTTDDNSSLYWQHLAEKDQTKTPKQLQVDITGITIKCLYTLDASSKAEGENEAKSFVIQSVLVSGNTKERSWWLSISKCRGQWSKSQG